MKKSKVIDMIWALSLIIIAIVTTILSITRVIGYSNSVLTVTLGVVELIAVFVLAFTTVKKISQNKSQQNKGE